MSGGKLWCKKNLFGSQTSTEVDLPSSSNPPVVSVILLVLNAFGKPVGYYIFKKVTRQVLLVSFSKVFDHQKRHPLFHLLNTLYKWLTTTLQTRVQAFNAGRSRMPAAISDRSKRLAPSSISCIWSTTNASKSTNPLEFPRISSYTTAVTSTAKRTFFYDFSNPPGPQVLVVSVHGRPRQPEEIASTEVKLQSTIESSPSAHPLLNPCGHTYLGWRILEKTWAKSYVKFSWG